MALKPHAAAAIGALVLLVAAGGAGWFLMPRESPQVGHVNALTESADPLRQAAEVPPLSAEQVLKGGLGGAATDDDSLQALNAYAASRDARSDCVLLRQAMITGKSPAVRVRALEVARDLALGEDRAALLAVLQEGLNNPYGEVRRAGLYACRDHPQFELMDELLAFVERGGDDRPAAVAALAFLDDPQAQGAVLQAAQSETLPRPERVQAVALLSRISLPEALDYLKTLAAGDDADLREVAIAALAARQCG